MKRVSSADYEWMRVRGYELLTGAGVTVVEISDLAHEARAPSPPVSQAVTARATGLGQ